MSSTRRVPEVRFPGFEDEWEQRKLKDLCESLEYGLNTSAVEYDGKHKYLRITDIDDNTNEFIQDGVTSPDIDFEGADNYILTERDVLFARTGASVGKTYLYRPSDGLVYYAGFLIRARILEGFSPEFVFQNTLTRKYRQFIDVSSQRSGQPGVNAKEYGEFEIMVPSLEEQEKLGLFFRKIDQTITLHQQKLKDLKKLKNGLLQKMFPQKGEKVPQVRFPGFTGDWEQRKLGDEVQITMGQSPDGKTYSEEPSDYILVQGNADLVNGWVVPRVWTRQVTKKGDAGDLIMSVRAPAGTIGKTSYDVVLGRGVAALKGNEFIFQQLFKMDKEGYWKKYSCGSTFESLNSDHLKNATIWIPSEEEQSKIGSFFSSLDETITLHQRKIDDLNGLKSGLLQTMFVA